MPADCILVEEMNITVDQTMYHKNQATVSKSLSIHYSGKELELETKLALERKKTMNENKHTQNAYDENTYGNDNVYT